MKKKFLYCFFIVCLFSCASHDKQNKQYYTKIDPSDLKKDVDFVERQLVKMHPDLYWYISKEALHQKFDSLQNTLTQPLTPNEFYLKISPVIASVHQGHMSMNMLALAAPDSLKKKYKGSINPLENFEYEYLNNRLFVKKNKSANDSIIQIGSEIIDINGIKPQKLFAKYRPTFTSDGYNQTAIPEFFARKFNSYLVNEIGFVDSVNFHIACADTIFHHTVQRTFKKSKKEQKIWNDSLKAMIKPTDSLAQPQLTKAEQKAKAKAQKERWKKLRYQQKWFGYDFKNKTYSKEISYPVATDSTIAILKINDFSEGKINVYDTIFAEFHQKKVQNLILDLRGNPGGRLSDIYKLSQYLNDSIYRFTQPATITHRGTFFNLFRGRSVAGKILGAPFISVYSLVRGVSAKRDSNQELKLALQSSKETTPKPLNYKNNLYVITDGMTFSAAAIISAHLKGRKRAIFVGNETGGTFNGTVAGIMPIVKLPHSKLKLRVGLMSIKPTQQEAEEGHGVVPDITIKPTAEEWINQTDPELQWILEDVKRKTL